MRALAVAMILAVATPFAADAHFIPGGYAPISTRDQEEILNQIVRRLNQVPGLPTALGRAVTRDDVSLDMRGGSLRFLKKPSDPKGRGVAHVKLWLQQGPTGPIQQHHVIGGLSVPMRSGMGRSIDAALGLRLRDGRDVRASVIGLRINKRAVPVQFRTY